MATREFAAKGLAGARVDAIARAARSNKQLVYYYFGSKIGLYNEIVGRIGPAGPRRALSALTSTIPP